MAKVTIHLTYSNDPILIILFYYIFHRNGSFPLDNCEVLTRALLKLIDKCYWNTTDSEGCMTSDENELSEACIKTLTVNIGHRRFSFILFAIGAIKK